MGLDRRTFLSLAAAGAGGAVAGYTTRFIGPAPLVARETRQAPGGMLNLRQDFASLRQVGVGATDADTAALDEAINCGRPVYVPAADGVAEGGHYSVGSTLTFRTGDARLHGDGAAFTTVKRAPGAKSFDLFGAEKGVRTIEISGLTIDGAYQSLPDPKIKQNLLRAVLGGGGRSFRLSGCRILNWGTGMGVQPGGFDRVLITENEFANPGGPGGLFHAVYVIRCSDVDVSHNLVVDSGGGLKVSGGTSGTRVSYRASVTSNHVLRPLDRGICVKNTHQVIIAKNHVESATDYGVMVGTEDDVVAINDYSLAGNILKECEVGMFVARAVGAVISGNIYDDCTKSGLRLRNSNQFVIRNEVFRNGKDAGEGGFSQLLIDEAPGMPAGSIDDCLFRSDVSGDSERIGLDIQETSGSIVLGDRLVFSGGDKNWTEQVRLASAVNVRGDGDAADVITDDSDVVLRVGRSRRTQIHRGALTEDRAFRLPALPPDGTSYRIVNRTSGGHRIRIEVGLQEIASLDPGARGLVVFSAAARAWDLVEGSAPGRR